VRPQASALFQFPRFTSLSKSPSSLANEELIVARFSFTHALNNLYFMLTAVPAGLLLARPGACADAARAAIDKLSGTLLALVQLALKFTPLAAFGAVARWRRRSGAAQSNLHNRLVLVLL
jgi:Na+/serine symporter